VTRRTGQGALYLYTCPHARFEGLTVYTNRPAGGSFRGLGAPLGHFALEVLIDQAANALGIDPLDYRLQFHVTEAGQPGQRTTPADQLLPDEPVEGGVPFSSNGLRACILAGAERIGWRQRRQPNSTATGVLRRGMGMAMGIYKGGIGREAEAEVRITPAGRVEARGGDAAVAAARVPGGEPRRSGPEADAPRPAQGVVLVDGVVVARARDVGERSQFRGTWVPGDPDLRFGLFGPGQ